MLQLRTLGTLGAATTAGSRLITTSRSTSRAIGRMRGWAVSWSGERITYALPATRYAYLVPARGSVMVNGQHVGERDGVAIAGETQIAIAALEAAEIILVDAA